jgi:hypothetical protein
MYVFFFRACQERERRSFPTSRRVFLVRAVGGWRGLLTSAYVSIRQHTSAYVSIRQWPYVSVRQHSSAFVSIRQHTSAYVSIRQHTCVVYMLSEHNAYRGLVSRGRGLVRRYRGLVSRGRGVYMLSEHNVACASINRVSICTFCASKASKLSISEPPAECDVE